MTKGFLGRRLSAILLAGAMLFALGGCGSSKTPISNVSSNPTAETTGLTESIDTTVSTDTAASTDTDTTASTDTTAATTPTKATTKSDDHQGHYHDHQSPHYDHQDPRRWEVYQSVRDL